MEGLHKSNSFKADEASGGNTSRTTNKLKGDIVNSKLQVSKSDIYKLQDIINEYYHLITFYKVNVNKYSINQSTCQNP